MASHIAKRQVSEDAHINAAQIVPVDQHMAAEAPACEHLRIKIAECLAVFYFHCAQNIRFQLCSAINPFAVESTSCPTNAECCYVATRPMLRRQFPIRNVTLTFLTIDRIVLILKAELDHSRYCSLKGPRLFRRLRSEKGAPAGQL